jgi:hypothetical protein
MLINIYGENTGSKGHEKKSSPADCTGIRKEAIMGKLIEDLVSNSYVERQNLTMRMGVHRFTRLTIAFSKKVENDLNMLSLYFVHYNFVRMHKTLK